ncbi:MAG TPA: class I SAM-dependent methyltransferase [Acidimicrobiales bacterium]|nr:MAG: hypothetical protein B7X07_02485 [Actinobacteria bacterium 21-64-8]HQT99215.1 class I SAM-dependent methyltransferase [Acidimicrobiales bacterium]
MAEPTMSDEARQQGVLWSQAATTWAELLEGHSFPAVRRALELAHLQVGERLLDVGCGAGGAMVLAEPSGVIISGIDAAPALIAIARERVVTGNFLVGDMTHQPYADDTFDVVSGFNSFQYPTDPVGALREARRVAKRGARFVLVTWGREERCEGAAHFRALRALFARAPAGAPPPLAADQRVPFFMQMAGLTNVTEEYVSSPWDFDGVAVAVRAMKSSGPVQRVVNLFGDEAVDSALRTSLKPFIRSDGSVHLENELRVLLATSE